MAKVEVKQAKNTTKQALIALAGLLIAYGFASLAIDRGNWLWYGLCFASLFVAIRSIIRLVRK